MSGISKKLMGTTAAGGGFTAIEDVFSTYLYTGNGSTQTITNGIDLAGEGGLVWLKGRSLAYDHALFDTDRGTTFRLKTNGTDAQVTGTSQYMTSFNSDGFTIGNEALVNQSSGTYASWTFRKAPRFFDVVTYTGTGSARTVSHNLGVAPGSIFVKRTNDTASWAVYHRSRGATKVLFLDLTNAEQAFDGAWNDTEPTDSVFTVKNSLETNASGQTYVAYLFAHDPLGPSGDGSDGLIACGSYTGNGSSSGQEIDLGWEPQWFLAKNAGDTQRWVMYDNMRGVATGGEDQLLQPHLSSAEGTEANALDFTATGFKINGSSSDLNRNGDTIIYIAIRRGPMRVPESGTEVFVPAVTGLNTSGTSFPATFTPDYLLASYGTIGSGDNWYGIDRIRGGTSLSTNTTDAETSPVNSNYNLRFDGGMSGNWTGYVSWMWKRAPVFFDVVAYKGNNTQGRAVPHNLGATPELMIVKVRDFTRGWNVYHKDLTPSGGQAPFMELNSTDAVNHDSSRYPSSPTATDFILGSNEEVNSGNYNYIAYLFATLAGISKVGSYTGNGSSQTIDCGFTSGARFILIKRTDSTGDWYVWDTARGIVTGNDPFLELNTTDAEVTSDDSIDPASSGFIVNQTGTTNVNVSSASYIFYAIA